MGILQTIQPHISKIIRQEVWRKIGVPDTKRDKRNCIINMNKLLDTDEWDYKPSRETTINDRIEV